MQVDNEEKWELEFWENPNGNVPVKEEMDKLRSHDLDFHVGIFKKIDQFKKRTINDLRKTQDVKAYKGDYKELSALRILTHKKKFRFLGCIIFNPLPPIFYAFHAFHKTKENITKELDTALTRLKKFKKGQNNKIIKK